MVSFGKIFNRQKPNPYASTENLADTLKTLKREERKAIKEAERYLPQIEKALTAAHDDLVQAEKRCRKLRYSDESFLDMLKTQTEGIGESFNSSYVAIKIQLDSKKKDGTTFNITLFGRTTVGKSTLMEILTHGDGRTIGKGAERTTRDIRHYEWNGLSITDVPGIDAFNGEQDEQLAADAARNADLIIFIITDQAPSSNEAEWLCRLKAEDKPLLCLCNCRCALGNEMTRELFLRDPQRTVLNKERLGQIIAQFNSFVQKNMPNERIDILCVQLLAEQYAMDKSLSGEERRKLHYASQFKLLEDRIVSNVNQNGLFLRQKSYMTVIDSPLYKLYRQMLDFAVESYHTSSSVTRSLRQFQDWQRTFNRAELKSMHDQVDNLFNRVRSSIPGFVDDNLENSSFSDSWKRHLASLKIQDELESIVKLSEGKVADKVNALFEELGVDTKYAFKFVHKRLSWRNVDIFNSKKFWGWGSAIAGAAAAFFISGPVGWVLGGVSALFGFFSWLSDSREKKLSRERDRAREHLKGQVDKMANGAHTAVHKIFNEEMATKLQKTAVDRLQMLRTMTLSLTNSQRSLALKYLELHIDVTTNMLRKALAFLRVPDGFSQSVLRVARIPGKHILIRTSAHYANWPFSINELCGVIGSRESIKVVDFNTDIVRKQIFHIFKIYEVNVHYSVKEVEDKDLGKQTIVYIDNREYSPKEAEVIELAEQMVNVQFIKSFS